MMILFFGAVPFFAPLSLRSSGSILRLHETLDKHITENVYLCYYLYTLHVHYSLYIA